MPSLGWTGYEFPLSLPIDKNKAHRCAVIIAKFSNVCLNSTLQTP